MSFIEVQAIDHIVVNVSDVERAAIWYQRVLGMTRFDYGEDLSHPRTAMMFGKQRLNLRPVAIEKTEWFTANHEAAGSSDLCFLVAATPDEVVTHLEHCGVEVIIGPIARDGARGELISVYCRDPDGSLIEIGSYEHAGTGT
ncbi:VOC family protein [Neorhizobium sp. BT27B]|uniref:VOC family protein n=1 Tax=Neorhizobium sp. BT27B TaxID=3142625 RepID=UPI003D2D8FE5